jgi:hypothetical protein
MQVRDAEGWAKDKAANPPPSWGPDCAAWPENIDFNSEDSGRAYGFTVILAAERWADEMEQRLAERPGMTVGDIANEAFAATDAWLGRWGLTGFQYGCVVSILARVWQRGEELRRWHNLHTQVADEGLRANATPGAVLNPALLNIEGPEA